MSQKLIDVYKSSTLSLAHSVVINHPYAARLMNERLKEQNFGQYTNDHDKTTWKYYLNMAGLYHEYDHDLIHKINKEKGIGLTNNIDRRKMVIKVATDIGQTEIEFNLENISGENADFTLAKEYQYGEAYYNELVNTYPECENLIRGILHPVPLSVSTNAPDFEVLYCGGYYRTRLETLHSSYAYIKGASPIYAGLNLIEDWEYTLVDSINTYTKNYFRQFDNRTYGQFNDLYFAANIGKYYLSLPSAIMNMRLERVKTAEVHTTHVQLYLNSFSGLGLYLPYLTRNQYMYLYRNLKWLIANFGKHKTFDVLINKLLFERDIPVIYYDMLHNVEDMPGDVEPVVEFYKQFDKLIAFGSTYRRIDTREMIEAESLIAKENKINMDNQVRRLDDLSLLSKGNTAKTKVIETQYINWGIDVGTTKEEFFLTNWIYSAIKGEYTGIISIQIPAIGRRLQLTIKNAVYLFLYSYARGYLKRDKVKFPTLQLHSIVKTLGEQDTPGSLLGQFTRRGVSRADVVKLRELSPADRYYKSVATFVSKMDNNWANYVERIYYSYRNSSISNSAEIEGVIRRRMYMNPTLKIDPGVSPEEWLSRFGLSADMVSNEGFKDIADNIISAVLYTDKDNDITMEKIHNALVNILKFFSSYNIQFITKTRSNEVSHIGPRSLRLEHMGNILGLIVDWIPLAIYPQVETVNAHTKKETVDYGWEGLFRSSDDQSNLLSQEQLKALILLEDGSGISILGD